MYDGSLEATIFSSNGRVCVYSPRSPGASIELVNHQRDSSAPEGAVYRVQAFMPQDSMGEKIYHALNGDVFCVYVGRNGIIFDDAARRRAADLLKK